MVSIIKVTKLLLQLQPSCLHSRHSERGRGKGKRVFQLSQPHFLRGFPGSPQLNSFPSTISHILLMRNGLATVPTKEAEKCSGFSWSIATSNKNQSLVAKVKGI